MATTATYTADDYRSDISALGLPMDGCFDADLVEAMFRRKAVRAHPDRGGSTEQMQRLNLARDRLVRAINQGMRPPLHEQARPNASASRSRANDEEHTDRTAAAAQPPLRPQDLADGLKPLSAKAAFFAGQALGVVGLLVLFGIIGSLVIAFFTTGLAGAFAMLLVSVLGILLMPVTAIVHAIGPDNLLWMALCVGIGSACIVLPPAIFKEVRAWIDRDFRKVCPSCHRAGVFEKVNDQLIYQGPRVIHNPFEKNATPFHYMKETWMATYRCSSCRHEMQHQYNSRIPI